MSTCDVCSKQYKSYFIELSISTQLVEVYKFLLIYCTKVLVVVLEETRTPVELVQNYKKLINIHGREEYLIREENFIHLQNK